ncbi:L-rhamnono-1,4-lactonase, partial [Lecanoromycetidae sp. Uapishka_2]
MSNLSIIDSHVHLWPESEVDKIRWTKGTIIRNKQSIDEYLKATDDCKPTQERGVHGFIFIEADRDRLTSLDDEWHVPLEELRWIERAILPQPDGSNERGRHLCLGVVAWGPVARGRAVMESYLGLLQRSLGFVTEAGPANGKSILKGFRHVIRDESQYITQPDMIDSLKWLGEKGYTFDITVDASQNGLQQMIHLLDMITKAHQGVEEGKKVKIVIDKMQWPAYDPQLANISLNPGHSSSDFDFGGWAYGGWTYMITMLAQCSNVFMKVSGGFSLMSSSPVRGSQTSTGFQSHADTLNRIEPLLGVILSSFGTHRIMFGSDWPACNIEGGGNDMGWINWFTVIRRWAERLPASEQECLWSLNAARAYNIPINDQACQ